MGQSLVTTCMNFRISRQHSELSSRTSMGSTEREAYDEQARIDLEVSESGWSRDHQVIMD